MTRFSSSRGIMYSAPPEAEEDAGTVEAKQTTGTEVTADD